MKSVKAVASKQIGKAATSATVSEKLTTPGADMFSKKKVAFNIHLVVPENSGISNKNVTVTFNETQLVIEILADGEERSNQVEGVKKIPTPPKPKFPLPDFLQHGGLKVTLSKKQA